ncbi:MAG TPA: SGNH/GDSL hydrolase family protein [Planctomycetota bacterium]|nr:SGNH/GDSL hydrolase family protein [Planctomycetota bacterium]
MSSMRVTAVAVLSLAWALTAAPAGEPPKAAADAETCLLRPKDVVLFFGNSIADCAQPAMKCLEEDLKKQYPALVQGGEAIKLARAGSGGEIAEGGAKRLTKVIETYKPTVCIVIYGTNEAGWQIEKTRFEPPMRAILRQLREAKVLTVVMGPPPVSSKLLAKGWERFAKARMAETGEMARKIAAEEGALYLDVFAAFKEADPKGEKEFTRDGVHLTDEGYRVVVDALGKLLGFGKPLAEAGTPRPLPTPASDKGREGAVKDPAAPAKVDTQTAK